jgi:antitoxin component of MazEF toxin-antitoxin module
MLSVKRKVHDQGGSLVLCLPKVWAVSQGLKDGHLVEIVFQDDFLTIKPVKAGDKPK